MSSKTYRPAHTLSRVERDHRNYLARGRNRRYYWRRKLGIEVEIRKTCNHSHCTEVVVTCGFCISGLCEHE